MVKIPETINPKGAYLIRQGVISIDVNLVGRTVSVSRSIFLNTAQHTVGSPGRFPLPKWRGHISAEINRNYTLFSVIDN